MKQIIQDLKSGKTILEEVPSPLVKKGTVLIKTRKSLVSLGTERMLVEFGKANLIEKARQQPEKVKMILDKIKTDGLLPTMEAVFSKLNQPMPLGYCNVGVVVEIGAGVTEFNIGDRVSSNGPHAEYVNVPQNLVAKIPDSVSDSQAAFTVIGAIGLQGIRLFNPSFGETVVVIGLGLIGLITAQLLKSNGCRAIGFDYDSKKVELLRSMGIEAIDLSDGTDPIKFIESRTNGIGADGVIITASSKSNEIISNSARMSRKRGRIILVGVTGLNLSRAEFYEKELQFQVSCSYGPGRYDEEYEQKGQDYPLPYVRWTEKRNFESVLNAISTGMLNVDSLITEEIELEKYNEIYDRIGSSKSIASLLNYSSDSRKSHVIKNEELYKASNKYGMAIIGAGNFTNSMILPSLKKCGANVEYIASSGGLSSRILSKKFGIKYATSDYQKALTSDSIDMVLITTRHSLHATMVQESLKAGKHVFVEKPLALKMEDVKAIEELQLKTGKSVVVGFNRRFSPHMERIRQFLGDFNSPKNIIATMNAGFIPPNMWVHDLDIGGGRIIGEACHYIDLLVFLAGSPVKAICMNAMGIDPSDNTDNASILLKFQNGSNGVINYFSNGNKSYSKERIEVYSQGKIFISDNFRKTIAYGVKGFRKLNTKQDKGHANQFKRLNDFLRSGGSPIIPFDEILNVSKASILAIESLKIGSWIDVE